MGSVELSLASQQLSMKVIYQILNIYEDKPRIRILNYLFHILDDDKNDRGLSILISHFYKSFSELSTFEPYLANAKEEIFEILLDTLKENSPYILELTERV